MNGFVVLGVRPGRIERLATIKVAAQERRLKNCPTVEGHSIRMSKALERIRQDHSRIELSPEYSAPQFAIEWARLAMREGFTHLTVAYKRFDASVGKFVFDPTEQQP